MNDSLPLDTDVVSHLFKQSKSAEYFARATVGKKLCICFVSVGELYRWSIKRQWGVQRLQRLETMLQKYIVLPFDDRLAREWATVMTVCESVGRRMAFNDAWIAATAVRYNVPLLSANTRDFTAAADHAGLRLSLK